MGTHGILLPSYGEYKNGPDSADNAKSYGLRTDYSLSKLTGRYAGITRIENGSAAKFVLTITVGSRISILSGYSINGAIIGSSHRF